MSGLKITFLLFIGLLSSFPSDAQIYVNQDATGNNDGSSWAHACTTLDKALDIANESDQIWVASGTYLPTKSLEPRSSTFRITKGIELYGGFSGTESNLKERSKTSEFETILSGDLNQDDSPADFESGRADNVYTVVMVENNSGHLPIIDGFTIRSGHANGSEGSYPNANGGGLFLYSPALIGNCSFVQNYSSEGGGGLYFIDSLGVGNENWTIANCQFRNNYSTYGGAVHLKLTSENSGSIAIQHSTFANNQSEESGGAIHIFSYVNDISIVVDSCNFFNNSSSYCGGATSYEIFGKGNTVQTRNSTFSENRAQFLGGAMFTYGKRGSSNNQFKIDSCNFTKNVTTQNGIGSFTIGGAIYTPVAGDENFTRIQHSSFIENKSEGFGGAVGIRIKEEGNNIRTEINNCQFKNNTSNSGGGLFYESKSRKDSIYTQDCQFLRNSVLDSNLGIPTRGGAMHLLYRFEARNSRGFIAGCSFQENQAYDGNGGALVISPTGQSSFFNISTSTFLANRTDGHGGAIFYNGTVEAYQLQECTFSDNQAVKAGANIYQPSPFGKRLFYIFFHGVLWFQILYSLLLYLIVREQTSLYYALMLFGLSLFFIVAFDVMNVPILNEVSGSAKNVLYQIGVFFSIFGFVKFAQQYLNINHYFPRFRKIIFYFLSTFLFFELFFFAEQYNLFGSIGRGVKNLNNLALLLCILVGGLIPTFWAITTLRKGFQPAKYLLLAMVFSGVALSWLVVSFFLTGSPSGIPIIHIECLLLLSIITLALADGYRINTLKKDKARAERLSELDAAKTRLYTNITHEFRTPLTVIMGVSDQVKGNEPEKQLIKRNSQQLLQLINQMLDLSKLESGALTLELQQTNIIPFIEYLVESFQSLAASKHIRLTFYKEVDDLQMDYDAAKMQQIIVNLISNAVKFTEASGKIVVHVKEESIEGKDHLAFIIRDNGAGIPEEDLPHVFDRFFQVDDSDIRRSEGSGVGLALVNELVQLMHGQIEVTSVLNEGTVFTIRIPITQDAPIQTDASNQNDQHISIDSEYELESIPLHQPFADDLPLLLIIEDNKDIVNFLRSSLGRQYKIEVARNGKQGIDKALDVVPDIIISDIMMPEVDGFTVCNNLKSDDRTSHVPIILLTAKATQEDKVRGLEVGADAYLSKPFDQKELEIRLQKLIESRKALHLRYQGNATGQNVSISKEDAFIQKLRSIILEKMEDEKFSINELCHAIGLSRMQVHRKLKALTGMPATAFINTVRLQKAYELLLDSDLNVSEVAYKVGFTSHSYFSKLFFNKYGKKPSEISE